MLKIKKVVGKASDMVTMNSDQIVGPAYPEFNDYGFTSPETDIYFKKYMETTAADTPLPDEIKKTVTRSTGIAYSTSKRIYDPQQERILVDEKRKKKEEEIKKFKPKLKNSLCAAPMDFNELLKLAEKQQHEPIQFKPITKKKSPERLLTARQKLFQLEQDRRIQSQKEREAKAAQSIKRKAGMAATSSSLALGAKSNAQSISKNSIAIQKRSNFNSKDFVIKKTGSAVDTKDVRPGAMDKGYNKRPGAMDMGNNKRPVAMDKGYNKRPGAMDMGYNKRPVAMDKGNNKRPGAMDKGNKLAYNPKK